jgi:hypothetical protein
MLSDFKRTIHRLFIWIILLATSLAGLVFFTSSEELATDFRYQTITDSFPAQRAVADINGDGMPDLFTAVDFESGQPVGLFWLEYPTWRIHPIAVELNFRGDDMETADVDNDGDADIVATVDNNGKVYWFENPLPWGSPGQEIWISHYIGVSDGYVKDVEIADLDVDGLLEVVTRSHAHVSIFQLASGETWSKIQIDIHKKEGMDVGDLDGDGDLDIALNGYWLETPSDLKSGKWIKHEIDPKWFNQSTGKWQDNCTNVVIADINQDDRLDVLICHSEKKNWPIIWYESENPRKGPWIEHIVAGKFNFGETLEVADFDGDGDLDVIAGEMKKSRKTGDLVLFRNNGDALSWTPRLIASRVGIYDGVVADIGNDGDPDIIGCRDYNKGPIDWWENLTSNRQKWEYIKIDGNRPDNQKGKMGLVFSYLDRDNFADIVAGSIIYLNPKGSLNETWQRVELPHEVDVYFAVNVDDDEFADLIGMDSKNAYWLEANDIDGRDWKSLIIASIPEARTQGYVTAQLQPYGKPELIFTRGNSLYYLIIPETNVDKGKWELVLISSETEEEGVAAGDIDRDGDNDLVAVSKDGHNILWLENSGIYSGEWSVYSIGTSDRWSDRVALKDINGDSRLDIISTEETRDPFFSAKVYWFECPEEPKSPNWIRRTIGTLRSINSMSAEDMNNDGLVDIVVSEHTDQRSAVGINDNLTIIYVNKKNGKNWIPYVVERGPHSSHLGAKLCDLDNDGDSEIASIAWKQYKQVHLWKNVSN